MFNHKKMIVNMCMKKILAVALMACFAATVAAQPRDNADAAWITIQNGQAWTTAEGAVVQAHAPVIVRIADRYFMLSSACTGWAPNQCKLSYSSSLKGGWSPLTNIGDDKAFRTQPAAILQIRGTLQTTYLYVGDRWMDPDLPSTKTIVFPIAFEGTDCLFDYRDRFELNLTTGEWR